MTARNVTRELLRFRECARHIWNTSFYAGERASADDGFRFDELQRALFKTLVVDKLGLVGSADCKSGPSARILVMIRPGKVEIQPASELQVGTT